MEPLEVNELEQESAPTETEHPSMEAAEVTAETETAEAGAPEAGESGTVVAETVVAETTEPAPLEEMITAEMIVEAPPGPDEDAQFKALIEAAIYITDEPLTPAQISAALGQPAERINRLLDELTADYSRPERGLSIREIAGGFKMSTKPEHHEAIRSFVKSLKPPLKLSLPALETLAVIAYKQPVTAPEIMEIRGVQGVGVLKTLLDRKMIAAAGRKQVIGKPILYKTTKDFLVQFGLKDLSELPTLKEFEELGRFALNDAEEPAPAQQPERPAAEPATLIAEEPVPEAAAPVEEPEQSAAEPAILTPEEPAPVAEPDAEPATLDIAEHAPSPLPSIDPQPQPVKAERPLAEEAGKEPAA
jgi:segregation and condensation protein B